LKSVKYYAFLFQHRYSLKEYLEQNYDLTFIDTGTRYQCVEDATLSLGQGIEYENTWVKTGAKSANQFGIHEGHGNVLTWEAIESSSSIVEAIPRVLEGIKGLTPNDSLYMVRLGRLLRLAIKRMQIARQQEVLDYIEKRNIEINKVDPPYSILTPIPYEALSHFLQNLKLSSNDLRVALDHLFITKRALNARYMPHSASMMVPVTHDGVFAGFHGRHVAREDKNRYFNTGFLHEIKDEVLFDETEQSTLDAIDRTGQVILTKGVLDLFAVYQTGTHQTVSSLNQGVSYQQYARVMNMPVTEIIVGHTSSTEQEIILGYQADSLKKIDVLVPSEHEELEVSVKSKSDLAKLINGALKNLASTEDGIRIANLRKRDAEMETLTDYGGTAVVPKDEILKLVANSKRSGVKLKQATKSWSNYPAVENSDKHYVRISKIFLDDENIDDFGMELRTLLFLLAKTNPKSGTINYTLDSLSDDLDVAKQVIIKHVDTLLSKKYLMRRKDVRGKGSERTVVSYYYPSTIKFGGHKNGR